MLTHSSNLRIKIVFLALIACGWTNFTWAGVANADNPPPRDDWVARSLNTTVLYSENFEGGGIGWTMTGGLWAVDNITSGPGFAHGGDFAAATNPHGDYPNNSNTQLVSPVWELPDGEIWLRFWHASDMEGGDVGDYGKVQVSCDGGAWEDVPRSRVTWNGGNVWGQALYDLSAYAGCTVQVAFFFTSNNSATGSGWYIDDVSIEEGALDFPAPEDFEGGFGDFSVTSGIWEVGAPSIGPSGAHSGSQCVGTRLSANYPDFSSSRLVTPPKQLSTSPLDGEFWLRFWHASDMEGGDVGDSGKVQVSCDGGAWEDVPRSRVTWNGGNVWGQALYDLSAYAGCTVQVAFFFTSNNSATGSGWYIDDVSIEEGAVDFPAPEDFEGGFGDFSVTSGIWEVGAPGIGPSGAHSGSQCVGTILSGEYPDFSSSRLVTPTKVLPSSPLDGEIWLRFWHASDMEGGDVGDYGKVQVSCDGGEWEDIPTSTVTWNGGNVWGQALYDLSAYAGCTVQVAFFFTSNNSATGSGWYIDDVGIEEGALDFTGIEDFEGGFGDFSVTNALWEVGTPSYGPSDAHSGSQCVGTILSGEYPDFSSSRLVTPTKVLPSSPLDGEIWLRFWHASDMEGGDVGDYGKVQVSCDGGAWEDVPRSKVTWNGGNVWGQALYDLSAYAGCRVQVAFFFTSNNSATGSGWYIDDVSIEEGAVDFPAPEDFEGGFGDFSVTSGIWEVGAPGIGPSGAHSGSQCVGTRLSANYPDFSSSRLVTPTKVLPSSPLDGEIWLRFWHASDMEGGDVGDYGKVQVSCDGGAWEDVPRSRVTWNGGNVWGQALYDLSAYAGCTVQVAFFFTSNNSATGSGWYIDDVEIEEGRLVVNNPEDFDRGDPTSPNHWWQGDANWTTTSGVWEVGEPLAGPGVAHSGSFCVGTILAGNYPDYSSSRFVTPEFELDLNPLGADIWLHYWQACDFEGGDGGDQGRVQVSCDGGAWEDVPRSTVNNNGGNVWSPVLHNLSAYAGCTVQVAFFFTSNNSATGSGWYIDDLGIHEGQPTFRGSVEGFETGTGGWSTSNGVWEIGVPTSGPGAAYEGDRCAATVLNGNYPSYATTRLLIPAITVSPLDGQVPTLFQFIHWYSLGDDQGIVEISVDGGAWASTGMTFSGSGGGVWNASLPFDLSNYSGSTVQFSFRLSSDNSSQSSGWYIDAVEFTNLDLDQPTSPGSLRVEHYSQSSIPPGDTITRPVLSWDPVGDLDLAYYAIYRGQSEDFLPDFGSRIALITGTEYTDLGAHGPYYHYKISSVDHLWNEGTPLGPVHIVAVPDEDESKVPQNVLLYVNYPNPFNPITTINFGLPSAQHARLVIYDLMGRKVSTLTDEVLAAGYHAKAFDADGLASGVYFYRLVTADQIICRKMVILK